MNLKTIIGMLSFNRATILVTCGARTSTQNKTNTNTSSYTTTTTTLYLYYYYQFIFVLLILWSPVKREHLTECEPITAHFLYYYYYYYY